MSLEQPYILTPHPFASPAPVRLSEGKSGKLLPGKGRPIAAGQEGKGGRCEPYSGKRLRQEEQAAGAAAATPPPVLQTTRLGKRRWEGCGAAAASLCDPSVTAKPVEEETAQPEAAEQAAGKQAKALSNEQEEARALQVKKDRALAHRTKNGGSPSVGENHQVRRRVQREVGAFICSESTCRASRFSEGHGEEE